MKGITTTILSLSITLLSLAGCATTVESFTTAGPAITATSPSIQPLAAAPDTALVLVEKEYSIAELKKLDISCVKVWAGSDNVTVTCGGNSLKLRYYEGTGSSYELTTAVYHSGTKTYLDLTRNKEDQTGVSPQTVEVSLPSNFSFYRLYAGTESGSVCFDGCISDLYYANSESGSIEFRNCTAYEGLTTESQTGRINVTGLTTGNSFDGFIRSESGSVQFSPVDKATSYHFLIGTKPTNSIVVNGQRYTGGSFELNQSATKIMRFESGVEYDGISPDENALLGTATFIVSDPLA